VKKVFGGLQSRSPYGRASSGFIGFIFISNLAKLISKLSSEIVLMERLFYRREKIIRNFTLAMDGTAPF